MAVVLVALGLVIQLPTTVAYYQRYYHDVGARHLNTWSIRDSQLWRMWPTAVDELREASRTDPRVLVERSSEPGTDESVFRSVALWWWLLPIAGVP